MNTEDQPPHGALVQRVERATALPLLMLALAYVAAYLLDYLPHISPEVQSYATSIEDAIVVVFAVELAVRIVVAQRRWAYIRAHWLDVVIVLIPFLRPLRFLRLLRLLPMLLRAGGRLRHIMGRYHGSYILTTGILAVFTCAALVTVFEGEGNGTITGFGEALWWAIATITTVGYGDVTPVTLEGRIVAVFLMLIGITLFGVLTASLSAYFGDSALREKNEVTVQVLGDKIDRLEQRLGEQDAMLRTLLRRSDGR